MMTIIHKIPKKYLIAGVVGILLMILLAVFWPASSTYQTVRAEIMPFTMEVEAVGEVQALKYESIGIPDLLNKREIRMWRLKITNLVSEGTVVNKGDFVASLDPSEVMERLRRSNERIEELNNSLESAVLDSTINLMQKREDMTNANDNLKESQIRVEQSQYESKATQRQAKIGLEKAQLNINAKDRNHSRELLRQKIRIARIQKYLNREIYVKELLEELKSQLQVTAPSSGLVVYGKSWNGRKIKVNDDVGPWMPTIATIPDLTSLISESIVKEIDIAKIEVGQPVKITIDAFPEDVFEGKVLSVANIGQPIKGTGMNGFKVVVDIDEKGKKILPSMTTSNKILIASYTDDVIVPREAVFGNDSMQYVFTKSGSTIQKKVVSLGGENETHIRVMKGLKSGDEVLISRPKEYIDETGQSVVF